MSTAPPPQSTPAPHPITAWIAIPIRITGPLLTVLVLLQPLFAGMFVTGDVAALTMHERNAELISYLALAHLILAVLVWRPGRRSPASSWLTLAFIVVVFLQFETGMVRALQLHFPVGVLLAMTSMVITVVSWQAVHTAPAARTVTSIDAEGDQA